MAMTYTVLALVLALVGTTLYLAAQSFRTGYLLLVVYYRGQDFIFLERAADGRYAVVPLARVPLAVGRFARARAAAALTAVSQGLGRYVPSRGHPFPLHRAGRRARAAHV
jgi:hypothetical protein